MIDIVVVCSLGLGSSFIIECNVKKYLENKNLKYNIIRSDITTAEFYDPDVYICSEDINFTVDKRQINKIELLDLMDEEELKSKLGGFLKSRSF
ncbi:MtlR transcriptional regulator [Clostridium carboxidivorans P7]|uniref:Phosphotransferase system lactose/cellobiose-specific IIB subunit n=1 Tax=Clostridium carboxidivorans P7 TaxID=536227 RepID=C6PWG9_9CLOT|nr:MtlR transcriptional regulator [Clostridium carboxidivorans]AKN30506.1 MtlR transcriptional regulator [Clostridium carboxidivorans P7]EET86446.1 phosphotransferase system lactose/cellobiose-specific IIB subunit [Clostridium carboxidivorans P7]EFG86246.1 PTS system, Lactose/Cellobiose specific IIB subunit [Clostridium carboxidivorans P7]